MGGYTTKPDYSGYTSLARSAPNDNAMFRSPLGEDLAALVLQFAMYDKGASETLTVDPTLNHFYRDHARGFVQEPGVEVTGVDLPLDGWYVECTQSDIPPRMCRTKDTWAQMYSALPYYEKDEDGCYIYRSVYDDGSSMWSLCAPDGLSRYISEVLPPGQGDTPPLQGWVASTPRHRARAPTPTLLVVL